MSNSFFMLKIDTEQIFLAIKLVIGFDVKSEIPHWHWINARLKNNLKSGQENVTKYDIIQKNQEKYPNKQKTNRRYKIMAANKTIGNIPLGEKMNLSIAEASVYTGIGQECE